MPVKKAAIPKAVAAKATATLTAKQFIAALKAHQSDTELKKIQRYFKSGEGEHGAGDQFMGIKMGQLFSIATVFGDMPLKNWIKNKRNIIWV